MNQAPDAVFVVERRPGQGYGITSAFGPRAQALQSAAVEVLHELGQPDPRGPEEVQRWVPDAGPDHQPVFVRIRRTPEGESVYHQTWFPPKAPPLPPEGSRRWVVGSILLLVLGGMLGWFGRGIPPVKEMPVPMQPPQEVTPRVQTPAPSDLVSRTDAALQVPVRRSREACKKLVDFLAQPGLVGWPDEADTVERTVELRDFRRTPRGIKIEPTYLTNDEVRALRTLLEALEGVR